jgi:hypothetical protein
MTNQEIRQTAKKSGVKLWQIADKLGINDGNLSRKLRHELTESERIEILNIIAELAKGVQ